MEHVSAPVREIAIIIMKKMCIRDRFKIGVNMQNPTNEDIIVYVEVENVEVRIVDEINSVIEISAIILPSEFLILSSLVVKGIWVALIHLPQTGEQSQSNRDVYKRQAIGCRGMNASTLVFFRLMRM